MLRSRSYGWALSLLWGASACAHGSSEHWADANNELHINQSVLTSSTSAEGFARSTQSFTGEPPPEPDWHLLAQNAEMDLLRFTAAQRKARHQKDGLAPDNPAHQQRWQQILASCEALLKAPPRTIQRRLLIQIRVLLEAERDFAQNRYGPFPEKLSRRIGQVFGLVRLHMAAASGQRKKRSIAGALKLSWPVSPVILSSGFGYRRDPILGKTHLRFHAGVDLAGRFGDVVNASAPGKVVGVGWSGGHGLTVTLQHTHGYLTRYCHLKRALVRLGDVLETGAALGLMGSSGRSTGPHLHFELRQGGTPLDPTDFIQYQGTYSHEGS